MLYLEIRNLKKWFKDKLILNIENLKIYSGDKIGVVGVNGAGKSTFLNIISEKIKPEEGILKVSTSYSYITQLNEEYSDDEEKLSGGEKTKLKIENSFKKKANMLIADEPTANLDINAVVKLEKQLINFNGAIILVSHDRKLLDRVCNKIIEIENGKVTEYKGNFTEFYKQKSLEMKRKEIEYISYLKEKKRLEESIQNIENKTKSINRAPKRMGNSEARLHKMGGQKEKASLDRRRKSIETRIKHLNVKEKPIKLERSKIDFVYSKKIYSKIIIKGNNINKRFGKKIILENADFNILNGSKVALLGSNGSGKTTLIKMIINSQTDIVVSENARIGYFSQELDLLSKDKTILNNIMESSVYDENFVRLTLARLLFKKEDVYKKVSELSGGERVKASFAKIILSESNMLILDEPTNYLDIYSMNALEEVLKDYTGTILFVSHDRKFVEKIADSIIVIKNNKLEQFNGVYSEYIKKKNDKKEDISNRDKKIILENKLAEIVGRISAPSKKDNVEELDKEYNSILEKIKKL
ncbi:ribosomal protection-like ABC-F family protein [Clostridium felsineum]|uniref:ribosomal protection-like ABC-F family protein n=1 Tax=Clostridium felsineum TaxID=36839 RepID=UPI00098CBE32|nr:ABC-F family ATP-binding cassette domain-containing protein [Clostridium felsineum]URZ17839.1 Nucleotide-binding protein ExpZ [Clostridium felsineum DSM 794]